MTSTVTYLGELRTEATHLYSGTQILTDAPLDNRGLAQAFSPTDLVATALASCMISLMGIKARDNDWNITGAKAEIIKEMASDPRRIAAVRIQVYMPAGPFDEKVRKILENVALTCPVAKSLHPDIEQDITFHWA